MGGQRNTSGRLRILRCNHVREGLPSVGSVIGEAVFLHIPIKCTKCRYNILADEGVVLGAGCTGAIISLNCGLCQVETYVFLESVF